MPAHVRLDPDLQEVRGARLLEVELAVRARRVPALMRCTSPGRIVEPLPIESLCAERAFEHVADDLHVAVAVRAEALRRPARGPR